MTSPISVGDAILLSQLAYRLGKSLTTNRKSSPDSFKEAQNQLFALGKCLETVSFARNSGGDTFQDRAPSFSQVSHGCGNNLFPDHIQQMISNCRHRLEQFEGRLEKYRCLEKRAESLSDSGNSLTKNAAKEWKKFRWTFEKTELESIQNDLAVHIGALNLAVSGMSSFDSRDTNGRLHDVQKMMKDVYTWFERNVKDQKDSTVASPAKTSVESEDDIPLTFELHGRTKLNGPLSLLCPKASFKENWIKSLKVESSGSTIFKCNCKQPELIDGSHADNVCFCLVESKSLIVRLAGDERSWQIFCGRNRVVPLYLKRVRPGKLREFQENVDGLARTMGQASLDTGCSSMFVYHSTTGSGGKVASVLDAKRDLTSIRDKVIRVKFSNDYGRSFEQKYIGSVKLLHYRVLIPVGPGAEDGSDSATLVHQDHCELILDAGNSNDAISRFIITINNQSKVSTRGDGRTIQISKVDCTSVSHGGEDKLIKQINVEIELVSSKGASELCLGLKDMMMDLDLCLLQFPHLGERLLLKRNCGIVVVEDFHFVDACLSLFFDPLQDKHRMVLVSGSHATFMAIDLPATFFEALASTETTKLPLKAHFTEYDVDRTYMTTQDVDFKTMLPKRATPRMQQRAVQAPEAASPVAPVPDASVVENQFAEIPFVMFA